jgi:hypothetical protein
VNGFNNTICGSGYTVSNGRINKEYKNEKGMEGIVSKNTPSNQN